MRAILLSLLVAVSAYGQAFTALDPAWLGQENVSGPNYLVSEDCEGTGTPSGWVSSGSGTIDWDYATDPLVGSQSLQLAFSAASATVYTNVPSSANYEAYFKLRHSGISGTGPLLMAFANGTTTIGYLNFTSTAGLLVIALGGSTITMGSLETNVAYHVWARYEKGTGTNAVCRACFSTTGTKPDWTSSVNGTSTAQPNRIYLGTPYARTGGFVIDKIRISTNSIGSNPP